MISRSIPLALVLAALSATEATAMTAAVSTSLASPAALGTIVTFTAAVPDAPSNNLWYRFRVRVQGGTYQIIRDYGPPSSLDWTATQHEGAYEMEVSARNLDTGDESTTSSVFQFQPLVTSNQPVITPTQNTLVFLYSTNSCADGSLMLVQFGAPGGMVTNTPLQVCSPGLSMNFYLAGLVPNTAYTAHQVVATGPNLVYGPDVFFTSGTVSPDLNLYTDTILVPSRKGVSNPILLGGPLGTNPVANDLAGNVLWYGPNGITFLTRSEYGGQFWGILEAPGSDVTQQVVRKFDLTGMTLLETNAARVNEQLKALGKPAITGFHHETRTISNGRIALLCGIEQVLTDVQGAGPVDVLGDMIVVLDQNLNVVWTWNSFDNLDVYRMATLGETCPNAGCPAFYLAPSANDWTHGNAIQETLDGNFLYSARNQDWLIKISYDKGNGDGHIIWRMGVDGDFQIRSSDPYPWFSHQHDGNFDLTDPTRLLVFDDGNKRLAVLGKANSRGQVFEVDETNRTAAPILNADLGVYSSAVGSAQRLRDGNYHFDAGFVIENKNIDSYSFEIDPSGGFQYDAHQNVILYRTFRMIDIYTAN